MNSSFIVYLVGVAIVAGGLGFGAYQLNIPNTWIGVGVAIVIGLGIMGGVTKTRRRDDSIKK